MKNDMNRMMLTEAEENMKVVEQMYGNTEGKSLILTKLQEESHKLGNNLESAKSVVELYFSNGTLF